MTLQEPATPRERRSVIARTVLRAVGTAALLLALYYLAPLDAGIDSRSVLLLTVCLLAVLVTAAWRIRDITRSDYPGLRAIQTLAALIPFYVLAFATTYYLMERTDAADFSEHLSRSSALYFSVTVLSTVGFGDITPSTDPARLVVTGQMFLDLLLLGFGVRVVVGAVQIGRNRKAEHPPEH